MRRFAGRRPFAFSVLATLALLGLDLVSRVVLPRTPVANIAKLPQKAFEPPVGLGLILSDMKSPDTLFWALATVLGLGLLVWLGWWREAGFNRYSRWKNLRLLLFPLLVCALILSGGVFASGPASLASAFFTALVASFGEEIVFRGLLWRALVPTGPVRAMILTSLLSGLLVLGRTATEGPWPEAVRLTALTLCSGFTYGALRWRTASIWPVVLVHTAFAFAVAIATLGAVTYPLMMLLSTLGFVAYGLYLLRNPRVRADGGLAKPAPPRVR
ncbi:MAG: CPBP family intramembrane metalloprotease [Actinomycetota bacterium]|nr:CPBP family intramembrane metalloprotease [Actinomycetota bacterium]